jgi:hypothetical protein
MQNTRTDILDRATLSSWSHTVHQRDLAAQATHVNTVTLVDWLRRQRAGGVAQTTEPTCS